MPEYCSEIGRKFAELFSEHESAKFAPSHVPLDDRLRVYLPEDKRSPEKRVQVLVGMILWLARSCRPDLSLAASALGSRVASWTPQCGIQIAKCVRYIVTTRESSLVFKWRRGDTPRASMFADADWTMPRSQSGFAVFALGSCEESRVLLHWGSLKQSFRAESPAASESAAAYCALKYTHRLAVSLQGCFALEGPVDLGLDNSQVLTLADKGDSEALHFMHKAANARIGLLKDAVSLRLIRAFKVASKLNPTNIFTKPLERVNHTHECGLLGLRIVDGSGSMWETRAKNVRQGGE